MMNEPSVREVEQKKNWTLTLLAFNRLLSWLDAGSSSEGGNYLQMRERLVGYFDRRNCVAPEDLADETMNRVARRLEEEGTIESESPANYCYIVARFVFMEHLREMQKGKVVLDEIRQHGPCNDATVAAADDRKERMLDCLERCANKLEPANRDLINKYYIGKERAKIENRRALAEGLDITLNALSIRACRIRDKLEACVRQCANEAN
jgi:DNA-directed RNA polymerase specialized sigma24 family protein